MSLAAILLWSCIFNIKISILNFGGSAVRPEDFLIAIILPAMWVQNKNSFRRVPSYMRYFFAFIGVTVISAVINGIVGRVPLGVSLLYALRQVEYFLFFFIGRDLWRKGFEYHRLASAYILYGVSMSFLSQIGAIPKFSVMDATRWGGNTSGPYEFAVVLAIMASFVMLAPNKRAGYVRFPSLFLAIIGIFMSQSRITLLAFLFVFRSLFPRWSVLKLFMVTTLLIVAGVATLSLYSSQHSNASAAVPATRFQNSSDFQIVNEIAGRFPAIKPVLTSDEYQKDAFQTAVFAGRGEDDLSAYVRFFRWAVLIKSSAQSVETVLIGLGPSFGTSAVDGNYVRIFVEDGVIGLLLIGAFFSCVIRKNFTHNMEMRNILVILLVSAIFIDVLESLRPMILFWSYLGYIEERDSKGRQLLHRINEKALAA